jgi:hypothetical protein
MINAKRASRLARTGNVWGGFALAELRFMSVETRRP